MIESQKLIEKARWWAQNPFTHDVAFLQVGGVINKIIAFATSLIFARVLGPEGYGFYSLVFALAGVIILFHDFGAIQGVTNLFAKARAEKNPQEEKLLLSYVLKILLFKLVTVGLITIALAPFLGQWFYDDFYLGLLAAVVVTTGALNLFSPILLIVLQSIRKIKALTIFESTHKILNSLIPIALVLLSWGLLGIVVGQLAAMLIMSIAALIIYWHIQTSESLPALKSLLREKLSWSTIKYYFSFGFQIAITKNLVKLNATLPLLILGSVLSTNSGLGYYKIAFAYISLPLLILGPVSRLLNTKFPETETHSHRQLFKRFWQVTGVSLAVVTPLTIIAVLVGPFFIKFFYGLEFEPSISIMYGLSLLPILSSLGVGLGPLYRTLHKMKAAIIINIITFALLIPTAYLLINNYSIKGLVITTLLFTLIPNSMSLGYFYLISKKQPFRTI